MPQINKQHITVSNRIVGSMWVDGGAIRGDGGILQPQLIVPLTIEMGPMPEEAMVATVWVRARLLTDRSPGATPTTRPVTELLLDGFPARSLPGAANDHTVELRMFLTMTELAALENHRHATSTDPFMVYLGVDAVVAGMRTYNELKPGEPQEPSAWHHQFGLLSEVLPFWNTRVDPLWISIEQTTWIRQVLPGIGYDASRLVEIDFPQALPGHPGAAIEWDKARRAYDERRYADSVAECRDLLFMWKRQLGATREKPLAAVVAERRHWPEQDGRRAFLDSVWKATTDISNAPHHPEGEASNQQLDAEDARLVLILTAALSAYLSV